MLRIIVFAFLLTLCYVPAKAQFIGQTKAYLIKKYEECLIEKNLSDYLLMECYGNEQIFTFDEKGLCNLFALEVSVENWNQHQTDVVWEGANCASRTNAPAMKSRTNTHTIIYTLKDLDYFFLDGDFDGNTESKTKSMAIRVHE